MARNRLTWQNVNAPEYGSSMRGLEAANRMFQDALGGLNTSLGSFAANRSAAQNEALLRQQEEAERGVRAQLASALGDVDAKQRIIQQAGNNPNLRADFLKDIAGTDYNTFLTGAKTRQAYDQTDIENTRTNRDNELLDSFRPTSAAVAGFVSSGGDNPFKAMSDEQYAEFSMLPAAEQTRLMGAWSGEQTSNLGRTVTQGNIDDRSEKRIVEDLVGAARAESPFIDEQQALIANSFRNGDLTPRMYEQVNQQLQKAASGGSGGGGRGTGTAPGGGSTLLDPRPSALDPSSPFSSPESQDILQNVDNVITDLTRGAGTVATGGVQRSDRARAEDISQNEAVARVMENKAFENADPVAVSDAIYEIQRRSGGTFSFAQAADALAMSPTSGSSWYNPFSWGDNETFDENTVQGIVDQWTSPDLAKDRETLQEIEREQTKLETARESIERDSQKLDEMVNHAFRNGLSQDTPAIRNLQEKIQLDMENLGKEAERIRGKNLGERIRNPSTGEFDYPANIREEEATAARERSEALAQAEKDAERIKARLKELDQAGGRGRRPSDTVSEQSRQTEPRQPGEWDDIMLPLMQERRTDPRLMTEMDKRFEYEMLRAQLNAANKVLRKN